jgi:hypothetical protein
LIAERIRNRRFPAAEAIGLLAAFAGIRLAADPVHGNRKRGVRLTADRAEGHRAGGKPFDDIGSRFDLVERYRRAAGLRPA